MRRDAATRRRDASGGSSGDVMCSRCHVLFFGVISIYINIYQLYNIYIYIIASSHIIPYHITYPPTPAAQGGARKGRRVTTTTATMTTMTTTTTTATATTSTCFECCLWAFRVVSLRVFGILLQMIGLGGVSAFPVVSVGTCWDTFCTCC